MWAEAGMNTVAFYRPLPITRPAVHSIFVYEEGAFRMPANQNPPDCATNGDGSVDHSANNAAAEAAAEMAEEYQAKAE